MQTFLQCSLNDRDIQSSIVFGRTSPKDTICKSNHSTFPSAIKSLSYPIINFDSLDLEKTSASGGTVRRYSASLNIYLPSTSRPSSHSYINRGTTHRREIFQRLEPEIDFSIIFGRWKTKLFFYSVVDMELYDGL